MAEPVRITPEEARKRVTTGGALFVCAYDDDEKFRSMHLEGGISLGEFKALAAALPKDREIIFYCA
jgi:rhodanese-related sulfurtransferase